MLVYFLLALAATLELMEFPIRTDVDVQLYYMFSSCCHIFMSFQCAHPEYYMYMPLCVLVCIYYLVLSQLWLVVVVLWPAKGILVLRTEGLRPIEKNLKACPGQNLSGLSHTQNYH